MIHKSWNGVLPIVCVGTALVTSPMVTAAGKSEVSLSGHINRAIWYADDGIDTNTSFVDNDVSSTRFRIDAKRGLDNGLTFGTQIEVEIPSNSSVDATIDQTKSQSFSLKERKIELYMDTPGGRLWLGQGDMASNDTNTRDLSATNVISASEIYKMGKGLVFRCSNKNDPVCNKDGFLVKKRATKDGEKDELAAVKDSFFDYDGGNRQDRIRYDTPSFGGAMLSVSATDGESWDVAAWFKNEFAGFKIEAALGYVNGGDFWSFKDLIDGSISILHTGSGINLTLAAAQRTFDGARGTRDDDATFYYGKLGYQLNISPIGMTALAIDYGDSQHEVVTSEIDDLDAKAFGAFFVQNFKDAGTELYVGYRVYQLDREFISSGTTASLEDMGVLMTGLRVKF